MWYLDLETAPRTDVYAIVPLGRAAANIKDPAKIMAAILEKRQKKIDLAAVSVDFGRIVVLGHGTGEEGVWHVPVFRTEDEERAGLEAFWEGWASAGSPVFCGFFASQFDVPMLVRRSHILGVVPGVVELGRYRHPSVLDLAQELTFGWMLDAEKLSTYARVFGLPHDDTTEGSEMPGLIAAGEYHVVAEHCRCDLELTRLLAVALHLA
jgi:hypothetical protein